MAMSAALDATRRLDWSHLNESEGRTTRLSGRVRGDTTIQMLERRHRYFPKVFVWQGRHYDVSAVQRCWTVTRRRLHGKVSRHCFRVRARTKVSGTDVDGIFDIYQDLDNASWHMLHRLS